MSDIETFTESVDVTTAVLSGAREKILEHRLVSDLAELMMRRGVAIDVMRGEFDAHGHDVVLEAAGVLRHVQLKAMVTGGKRRDVNVNHAQALHIQIVDLKSSYARFADSQEAHGETTDCEPTRPPQVPLRPMRLRRVHTAHQRQGRA